jgi:hypothetical protein
MLPEALFAIDEIAQWAAESAIDAHGEAVDPLMAWEFMKEQIAPENDRIASLFALIGDEMPRQFQHDYQRHCRIILGSRERA